MYLTSDHYRAAALERIAAARGEYHAGRHADCIYLAGLAVESMLRAYRLRISREFDSRHDLADLMKVSGLEGFVPLKRRSAVGALLGEIWMRWKNDYRFASRDRLETAFRQLNLHRGVEGDIVKANAYTVINCAYEVVSIGEARWQQTSSKM